MKIFFRIIAVTILFTLPFCSSSCKKSDFEDLSSEIEEKYDVSLDEVTDVSNTEAIMNIAFSDIFNIGIRAGAFADEQAAASSKKSISPSEDVAGGEMTLLIIDGAPSYPATVIINWGDINKEDDLGHKRRGKIKAVISAPWENKGSEITISFKEGYYFNDNQIEGDITLKNNGSYIFNRIIENGKITTPDKKEMTRTSNINMKWI